MYTWKINLVENILGRLLFRCTVFLLTAPLAWSSRYPVHKLASREEDFEGQHRIKVLFAILSIGNSKERNNIIRRNLDILHYGRRYPSDFFIDCSLFAYAKYEDLPEWFRAMQHDKNPLCTCFHKQGMGYLEAWSKLTPSILKKHKYDYLMVTMDDVSLHGPESNLKIDEYLHMVVLLDLAVATPSIENTYHKVLRTKWRWIFWPGWRWARWTTNIVGREVDMVEIQSTTFRMDAYSCWFEMIDLRFPSGWGLDLWWYHYCAKSGRVRHARQGVIDVFHVVHNKFETTHLPGRKPFTLMREQEKNWSARGVVLKRARKTSLGWLVLPQR
ncbi:hypothetical protein DUNSADRAFT_2589 [Dunaliella salina]|uniref:Uncharacterized protein n=1 Tax=Dunaliella salina TaxID=3046 RepID=A0ABQ7FW38_DUNSA|nr:hypothetical protein DUNSADRAFT_2589 [Dunaliella salina]|eukprot:KAF5826592.1 hypothetical protein DUNSADRAFT_2589 [Dunaliella salina]